MRAYLRERTTWLVALAFLALGLLFAWEVSNTARFVVDDAYITFSFSKNLARGLGPVYGHGVRVEGYSNFLWMVLVAVPLVFSRDGDPLVFAHVLSVPFLLLLLGATYALVRARGSRGWALLAAALLAVDVDVVLAFDSGLETLPYTALVVTGFALLAHAPGSPVAARLVVPVMTAAALTRIDGFAPLLFVIGWSAAAALARGSFSLRDQVRAAAGGVLVWGAWFAWRYAYYGLPLPSTYYAKALIAELMPRRGTEYVLDEVTASGIGIALPAFGYLLWKRHRPALPVGLFAFAQLAYVAHVGGDWMPSGRFVLPAMPLLFALVAWAGCEIQALAADRGAVLRVLGAVPGLLAALWIGTRVEPHVSKVPAVQGKLALSKEQDRHVATLKRAAEYLAAVVPPGGRLVTDYGGVIAYYTDAAPIEMWGLCNADIATHGTTEGVNPIYGRTCPECYVRLAPEYFHVVQPLVRQRNSFTNHLQVVRAVWQTDTIGRYIDFGRDFVSGRVVNLRRGDALWFLERRGSDWRPRPRASGKYEIEYPFVEGGTL